MQIQVKCYLFRSTVPRQNDCSTSEPLKWLVHVNQFVVELQVLQRSIGIDTTEYLQRTCSNVRQLLLAENVVRLRMFVKQLLGNDASRLLSRFSNHILDRRQTTSGTAVSGVLVTVSSSSSDVHLDSSWTRSSVTLDWVPEQSTINFVHASWPSSGEQLHWAGHRDFRAAVTSSSVVHVMLSIPALHWVEMASLTGPSEVSAFLWPSIWLAATNTALPVYASVASHRWKWVARIATKIQIMTLSVVNASTFSHTSQNQNIFTSKNCWQLTCQFPTWWSFEVVQFRPWKFLIQLFWCNRWTFKH